MMLEMPQNTRQHSRKTQHPPAMTQETRIYGCANACWRVTPAMKRLMNCR